MVGALADWFAVTALFRHPLGLPIPHTAIIPSRKDQIGRSLGEFVEGNFLDPRGARRAPAPASTSASGSARWLAEPANAAAGAGGAVRRDAAASIEVLDDRDVQDAIGGTGRAPAAGRSTSRRCSAGPSTCRVDGGHHQRLLDAVLKGARRVPRREPRRRSASRLEQESPWWVPEPIDDRIFNKIFSGVQRFLADVARRPGPRGAPLDRGARPRARRAAAHRPGADRQGRGAEGRAARPPRGAGVAASRCGARSKQAMLAARRRPRQRAAPPARRRAGRSSARALVERRRAAGARSTTGSSASLAYVVEQLPQRGRRPDRHDGRALGRRATRPGASSCRSAATCSSSASTARSSAASPASDPHRRPAAVLSDRVASETCRSISPRHPDVRRRRGRAGDRRGRRPRRRGRRRPGDAAVACALTLLPLDAARGRHQRGVGRRRVHGATSTPTPTSAPPVTPPPSASSAGSSTSRSTRPSPPPSPSSPPRPRPPPLTGEHARLLEFTVPRHPPRRPRAVARGARGGAGGDGPAGRDRRALQPAHRRGQRRDASSTEDDLDGLPDEYRDGLARDDDGRYRITMAYPDVVPFLENARRRDRRQELNRLFNNRAADTNRRSWPRPSRCASGSPSCSADRRGPTTRWTRRWPTTPRRSTRSTTTSCRR